MCTFQVTRSALQVPGQGLEYTDEFNKYFWVINICCIRIVKFFGLLYSLLAITSTIQPCPFFSILSCIFLIIIARKKKRNRCDLKKINYSNFFLSVSKLCASLICSGGICPGGICPRGYMSQGVYVPGGICPRVRLWSKNSTTNTLILAYAGNMYSSNTINLEVFYAINIRFPKTIKTYLDSKFSMLISLQNKCKTSHARLVSPDEQVH